jgi:hypothetical protein
VRRGGCGRLVDQNGVLFKAAFQTERLLGVLDVGVLECVDDARFPEYISEIWHHKSNATQDSGAMKHIPPS